MIKVSHLHREHRDAGAFQRLVSVQSAVGEGVFVTKSGAVLSFIRVDAPDYECLDPEHLDRCARRFEAAIRGFDERFRLYQYLIKRASAPATSDDTADPVLREALTCRNDHLQRSGPHYHLNLYFAIVFESQHPRRTPSGIWRRNPRALLALLSQHRSIASLEDQVALASEFLTGKVAGFIAQLQDVLPMTPLDSDEGFSLICRLLNYNADHTQTKTLHFPEFVDFQACGSTLESHAETLRLDDQYVQVLTLKDPPPRTWAGMFRTVMEVACNAVVALEWQLVDALQVRRLIQSKRRHYHNSKTSALNYLNQKPAGVASDALIDDGAVAIIGDLGSSLQETELRGKYFGRFSLTIALHDRDLKTVHRGVAHCLKTFGAHDARLIEERYNRLNAWLAILPGNAAYNVRHLWLLNTNYADVSFLSTIGSGSARNEYLNAPALAIFEGSGGIPYHFNLHCNDVAHTLVLGATGSGKSFLLNFLITFLQRYAPTTVVFDLGGSYENLTRLFNGRVFALASGDRPFTINPFCLEPSPENLRFLLAFVKVLVESNGWRLGADDEKDLFEQIENLYSVSGDQRRLLTLANVVRRPVRQQLAKWVQGGPYAALFDNPHDTLTFSRFQTFDFDGMSQAADQLEPLLFWLLYRTANTIAEAGNLKTLKVFVIDEAWRFFRHPVIRAFIVEAIKTWRKKNAVMIMATQSGADLLNSELLPTLVESCVTKLFLSNPGMDRQSYQTAFHLNATEADLVARLTPKEQILMKQPHASKLLHLRVDPRSYWLYTNNPQDNARRQAAFDRFGFHAGLDHLARRNA